MVSTISILDIQALAEAKVFERGKNYYEGGEITATVKRGYRLEAFCYGSQIYRVTANVYEGNIGITSCTYPYDWGGICKQRVALLLTYLLEPKRFTERPTIPDLLKKHDKDDLISLIENMLNRHADLMELIDPDMELPEELFWDDEY